MRNIIITGGELYNKGAQSMLFIAVHELKKRFPEHEIFVLSPMDLERSDTEKAQYNFKFIGWYPLKFSKCQRNPILRWIYGLVNKEEYNECESIYNNCDMLIDVSGYALGSNWGLSCCNVFLEHLEFAKAFHIPFYLMPQSFGPFDFQGKQGKLIEQRIRAILPEAELICAREQEGYDELVNHYHLKNVRLMSDLVLNNRKIDLLSVYKKLPVSLLPDIPEKSVGIIPNSMTIAVADIKIVLDIYRSLINELKEEGKYVYLLSHADSDLGLCAEIKRLFANDGNVRLINQNFSCFEFSEIVKKFEFVIASRFHSIVHAYKNGIPCVSLGWATKYHDLLSEFSQEQYAFEVSNVISIDRVVEAVRTLNEHVNEESMKIREHLSTVQQNNVFDILPATLEKK